MFNAQNFQSFWLQGMRRKTLKHLQKTIAKKVPIQNSNFAAEIVQIVTNKQGSYSTLFW